MRERNGHRAGSILALLGTITVVALVLVVLASCSNLFGSNNGGGSGGGGGHSIATRGRLTAGDVLLFPRTGGGTVNGTYVSAGGTAGFDFSGDGVPEMRVLNPDTEDGAYEIDANRNGSRDFYVIIRELTPAFASTTSATANDVTTRIVR